MSETSDLTSSFSKMKGVMKDALSTVDKEAGNISDGISSISDFVKNLENRIKGIGRLEEEKIKKEAQIQKEIEELEKQKDAIRPSAKDQSTGTDQTDSKLTELKDTLANTKDQCADASKELSELERSLNEKRRETDKLKSELQSIKRKHESDIQPLRKSHDESKYSFASKEARHKALRILTTEKAVSFPELKIVEALRQQPTTKIDTLEETTQLKPKEIESVVKALAKKTILQYDSKTGEVRVLRQLEP